MSSLNEGLIKAAVIDKLFCRHIDDDAVLINEMVVAKGARRADLAVANGYLHAFEIKSDLDTLVRLDAQLTAYTSQFDKVTVVVTSKFVEAVLEKYPENVEVWEARSSRAGCVRIWVRRRGECRPIRSILALSTFLRKTDIALFLRSEGVQALSGQPRSELQAMLGEANLQRLRHFVLSTIKKRYRSSHDVFMERRRSPTHPSDLVALRRIDPVTLNINGATSSDRAFRDGEVTSGRERAVDVERLAKRYGITSDNIPPTILIRKAYGSSRHVIE